MSGKRKLTEMQVRAIRANLEQLTVAQLARVYGVSGECIRKIRTGETWQWLDAFLPEVRFREDLELEKRAQESAERLEEKLRPVSEPLVSGEREEEILKRYSGDRK